MSSRSNRLKGNGINPAMLHAPLIGEQQQKIIDVPRLPPMKSAKFTPIGSMVAVIVDTPETETYGDIVIPEAVSGRFWAPTGTVIAVGPECKQVKAGDRILGFPAAPGGFIRYKGEEIFLIEEIELAGVLTDGSQPRMPVVPSPEKPK